MVFRKQCMYSPFTVKFKPSASPRRKTQDAQILGFALMYNVVRCFYQNRNIHIVSSFRRKWVSYEQWVSCVVIHILCVTGSNRLPSQKKMWTWQKFACNFRKL